MACCGGVMALSPASKPRPKVPPGHWARAAGNIRVRLRFLAGRETDNR